MPKVKVMREITVRANDVSNVLYPKGYEGKAPRIHVDAIVAAEAGEELEDTKAAGGKADERAGATPE